MPATDQAECPPMCPPLSHELLGLPADERDPVRIVDAAARRLATLRAARGSESAVREALAQLIRTARDEMLRATC